MLIIGCDFHTRTQQMALLDTETGKVVEGRLEHEKRVAQVSLFRPGVLQALSRCPVGGRPATTTNLEKPQLREAGAALQERLSLSASRKAGRRSRMDASTFHADSSAGGLRYLLQCAGRGAFHSQGRETPARRRSQ
jgi:hypothetical protein